MREPLLYELAIVCPFCLTVRLTIVTVMTAAEEEISEGISAAGGPQFPLLLKSASYMCQYSGFDVLRRNSSPLVCEALTSI